MRNQHTELLRGLPPSGCRFWPFITESKRRVHTAESEIAEALSKGYNSVTVTPADHGGQFPVPIPHSPFPIPHSALQIVLTDGEEYRAAKACLSGVSAVAVYPIPPRLVTNCDDFGDPPCHAHIS